MLSKRFVKTLVAGGTVGALGRVASASMVVGLRAIGTYADTNYNSFAPLSGGDTPTAVRAVNGKVISIYVYAQVTQSGPVGDQSAGGAGWPVFSVTEGRIASAPMGAKANVIGNFIDASVSAVSQHSQAIFATLMATAIDNGNTDNNASNGRGWVKYCGAASSTSIGPDSTSASGQGFFGMKPDGSIAFPISIPGGFEYYLGEVAVVVADASTSDTVINWSFRPHAHGALWFENADRIVTTSKAGTQVTYNYGTPGTSMSAGLGVTLFTPEPAVGGTALAALSQLSLLFRRYNRPR